MVVEDQPSALGEVEPAGEGEDEELGGHRRLGEAAEYAEGRHPLTHLDLRAGRSAAHDPRHLAPGHERQRRFQLVLPARLQQLREGHAGGVHLDDHARPRREHVRGLGLGQLDQGQGAVGTGLIDDLDGSHGRDYVGGALSPTRGTHPAESSGAPRDTQDVRCRR